MERGASDGSPIGRRTRANPFLSRLEIADIRQLRQGARWLRALIGSSLPLTLIFECEGT